MYCCILIIFNCDIELECCAFRFSCVVFLKVASFVLMGNESVLQMCVAGHLSCLCERKKSESLNIGRVQGSSWLL